MTTTVSRAGEWIFGRFPDQPTDRQINHYKNMWWRVALSHIPPRDPRFEFEIDLGIAQIPAVLSHKPLRFNQKGDGQYICFFFPERWMTTQEEQFFPYQLTQHPQVTAAKMTVVEMVTKSPLIIRDPEKT